MTPAATLRLDNDAWLRRRRRCGARSALLNGDGEEARVVGGAARNALIGLPLSDIDIATTARPRR